MSEMFDYAAYLSEQIGPRPAGTEEERQAAFYVAETLQRKAGLQSQVEDFTCAIDYDLPRAILCGISIVLTLLSIIFPILVVPAFIVTLVTGALYCVEVLFRPVIARAISHGASQNVVARYEPNEYTESTTQRHRKVVLLSHYDTGKVQPELSPAIISALPIIHWAELGGMVLIPLLLLIRLIFIPTAVFGVVVTVLSIIAMVLALLPVLLLLLRRTAPYNEGANCNASGVAVLMEVAARVRNGRAKALAAEAEVVPTGVRIHGAAAARANGLVPDGAELVYEASETDEEASPEDRLMAAKAAVAMLTGKPVSASVNIDLGEEAAEETEPALTDADIAAQNAAYVANALEGVELPTAVPAGAAPTQAFDESVAFAGENSTDQAPVTFMRSGAQAAAAVEGGAAEAGAAAPTVSFMEEEKSSVPDWFTAARAKAKQNAGDEEEAAPIQRSRYAQAMEMAQREIDARIEAERAEAEAQTTPNDTEARLEEMRASIIANYPTSAEAAAAAAKKAAEGDDEETVNVENATTAFAPVKIDGEQLKQEAAAQAETSKQVVVQGEVVASSADTTGELPIQSRPLSASIPLPVPEAAQAPAVDAAKLQSLIPQLNANKTKPSEDQQARQSALRQVLPSLSGSIKLPDPMEASEEQVEEEAIADSPSESFSPVTATAVFSAIDEGDYEVMDEEYADDVDESHYEPATPAETGYVEMPKSRASRLFGKFRRNKKAGAQRETSAQEWLDVDEDFDARKVGAERGGWESFREDYEGDTFDDSDDGYDDFEEAGFRPRGWNGGAFSLKSLSNVGGKIAGAAGGVASRFKKGDGTEADVMVDEEIDYVPGDGEFAEYGEVFEESSEPLAEEPAAPKKSRFGFGRNKDAANTGRSGRTSRRTGGFGEVNSATFSTDLGQVQNEQQAIRDFHEPNIEVEVWFVALGAELAGNGGIDAFIAEHREELKGAIFVDVEALGAGELMLVEEEGMYFPVKASSRMDRYSRKAAAACGMHIDRAKMLWRNSAAAAVLRNGSQAMHLVGMKDGKPAYFAQRNDTMSNIDEETLERNADLIVELLRSI